MWFVSHATTDDEAVNGLYNRLISAGFSPGDFWIDHQRISAPQDWNQAIQNSLNACTAGLYLLSPRSVNRPEIENEWRTILDLQKPLFVVLIAPVDKTQYPYRLRTTQYADLSSDLEKGTHSLIEALRNHVPLPELSAAISTAQARHITGRIDSRLLIPMQGRDADIASALSLLKQAPLFITGIGGIGKSRLAYALVNAPAGDWSGSIWHNCTQLTTVDAFYELAREHYNLDSKTDPRDLVKRIRADGHLLVVLDNAEYVIDDIRREGYLRLIDDLHNNCCAICITTRNMDDWRNVTPKRNCEPTHLDINSAMRLLQEFARAIDISFDIMPDARSIVAAARLHPRLIQVAVAKLAYTPSSEVISELKALRSPDMQHALTEMIGVTTAQMTAKHGNASLLTIRRLSTCRGGFTLDAARMIAVAEDDNSLLGQLRILTEYRFIRFDGARYNVDELVKEAVGIDEAARRAHYAYYLELARRLETSTHHMKYVMMDADREEYDAAFDWALSLDPVAAYWLAMACQNFLINRGRFPQQLERLKNLERVLADYSDTTIKSSVQKSLGMIYSQYPFGDRRSNLWKAAVAFISALDHHVTISATSDYSTTLYSLGDVFWKLSVDYLRQATGSFTTSLSINSGNLSAIEIARTQYNLGNAFSHLSLVEEPTANLNHAIKAYEVALEFYSAAAFPLDYATIEYHLGECYRSLASFQEKDANIRRAEEAYNLALAYHTDKSSPLEYAIIQHKLGLVLLESYNIREAILCWRRAEEYYRLVGYESDAEQMQRFIERGIAQLEDYIP